MLRDLRSILDGWDYEPGKISVRKIIGRDGREKIQTRIDLGVLQLEGDGRPDGKRPHGCESLLEYQESRLGKHLASGGTDDEFVLTPEECRDLRHEAYLYYQRYLSQFVLEEFEAVDRDTERNLRVIDFCERYGATPFDRTALSAQRAYVLMMNCRSRVYEAMQQNAFDSALRRVEEGIADIHDLPTETEAIHAGETEEEDSPELNNHETELRVLLQLRRDVLQRMPADAMPRLQWELQAALEREDYEKAAQLRDQLATRNNAGRKSLAG